MRDLDLRELRLWHRMMADGSVAEDGSPRELLSDDGSLFSGLCAELGKRELEQVRLALATQSPG